jgi:cellulose synthase (UDP-forming)
MLHEHGWKSLFVAEVLAIGQAPDNIISYFKQQKRWAQGGFTIFFQRNPMLSRNLTTDQRIQYTYTALFYFIGISVAIYLILPLIYLYFGLTPIHVSASLSWSYHYLPYLAMFYALPLLLIGRLSLAAIATSLATFYPYVEAFFDTIFANRYVWITTSSKGAKKGGILFYIWPHVLIIVLSVGAAVLGWFAVNDIVITTINCCWALVNASILTTFIIQGTKPADEAAEVTAVASKTRPAGLHSSRRVVASMGAGNLKTNEASYESI